VLVSRVMIGIGTASAYPAAMVAIRRGADARGMPSPPGRLLGWLAIAGQATVAVGLPLGGLVVGLFGWRATFALNFPLAGAALALTLAGLPRDQVVQPVANLRSFARLLADIDAPGIALFCTTVVALIRAVTSIPETNGAAIVATVLAAAALVAVELRVATPFFDIRALRRHMPLTITYLRTAGTMFGFYAVIYGVTQWLQEVRSMSALTAGAVVLPLTGAAVLVSIPAARSGAVRRPLLIAAGAAAVACVGLALVTASTPVWVLVLLLTGFGVTLGYGTVSNQAALYCQAPAHLLGTAAGLQRTFVYLSAILSATLVGLFYRHGVTPHGLHLTALILLCLSAVILVVTLLDRTIPSSIDSDQAPAAVGVVAPSLDLGQTPHPSKRRPMADKRMTPADVVTELRSGMTIGIGGWASRRKPMALIRELLRSDLEDLTVVSFGGPDVGLLCATGKVRRVVYGFVSLDSIPLEPHFQAARQAGRIAVTEYDEGMLQLGLYAAACRLPFLPTRSGLGSDVMRVNPELRTVVSPYPDAEELVAVPAIPLDAALVHLNRADARGNAQFLGPDLYFDDLFCAAAERAYVSCERVVPTEELVAAGPATMRVSRWMVAGVIEAPNGAHFTSCAPDYGRDEAFQAAYVRAAADPNSWAEFLDSYLADDGAQSVPAVRHAGTDAR
jgi:glutaconate CoA-transferase subunit A